MKMRFPSPAMAVALVALFAALGGTGYAAGRLSSSQPGAVSARGKTKTRQPTIATLVKKDVAAYFKAHAKQLKGAQGVPGQPGQPGAAGSAIAYAHVNADGTLDGPNSKNVTSLSHPSSGNYCLEVAGTPHNAVVTPGLATGISIADSQGVPFVDLNSLTGCPPGTNVRV